MAKSSILHIRVEPALLGEMQSAAGGLGLSLTEAVTAALRKWLDGFGGGDAPVPAPAPPRSPARAKVGEYDPPHRVVTMTMAEAKRARLERLRK